VNLQEILSQIKVEFDVKPQLSSLGNIEISDIEIDSRKISAQKNSIFFALDGKTKNGEEFVASAISKGARVVVAKKFCSEICGEELAKDVTSIKTANPFLFLVECLKIFYAPLPANIYAVTGTNGKTSTVEFIRQILQILGNKSASIGTLGVVCEAVAKEDLVPFDLTTPDIVSLYKNLFVLCKNGVNDVAIEVSSIGLEQARVAGLNIEVGGFTNFTQDHLDYHKTMEEYFLCKMLLFEAAMPKHSAVVLNADIAEYDKILKMCASKKHHIFNYGRKASDLRIVSINQQESLQFVVFECGGISYNFVLNVAGEFQVYNVLCALGMVMAKHHLNAEELKSLLSNFIKLRTASGRMQNVATLKNGAQVFVDFAHSPDALTNVLKLARSLVNTASRLIVLFGCGGDRDNKKRPIMGEIASQLADVVIVTDDNPRSEDAKKIRAEILVACNKAKTIEIADRKVAIAKALEMLQEKDILILAGKGHEKYQIIGDKKSEFDEEKIVREALKTKG
jgi:UDP-N-acetylmuramoyl-L-alanyl-D-glutamate--2,6-diaminopimelate ligase